MREGTVLVTGATGFLGTSLLRRLLHDGGRVRALVRSPPSAKPLADRGAEVVVGGGAPQEWGGTPRDGGATTTSLEATKLGRGLYARLGYGDLGELQMWERRASTR